MKLRDIVETYISGDWGEESQSSETPNAIYCVRGADIVPILNTTYGNIPKRYVSSRSFSTKILSIGDIVIEKSGGSPTQSTGRVVYISKELKNEKPNLLCSNFCVAIRIKNGWNPKFVFYYWQYIYNQGIFFNFEGKTSGLKNLQLDNALSSIMIPDIPIAKQNHIVKCLESFESKIALNREINRNLEAMARQLYDYWFVQFDFPDENGNPYKSSGGKMVWNEKLKREIPEGWSDTTLGMFCDMYQPKTIGINELDENGAYLVYGANGIVGRYYTYNHKESEIAMACRGNSCGVVNRTRPYSWITGNAMVIRPKDYKVHNEYVLQAIPYMNIGGAISGSGQPQLTRENLSSIRMYSPISEILYKYSAQVSSIVDLQLSVENEIENLKKQRDELLPLLMNGQVSVMPTEVNCDLSHD